MNKIKVIALFGKSASGKDTIQKAIIKYFPTMTHSIISCTTRPKRDYEEEGKDYYFLTTAQFAEKVLDGSMLEATEFNDWFYGAPIEALQEDKVNIGVFNPAGIEALLADTRIEVLPIFIVASDKTRLLRSLNREAAPDCAEICRRYFTDDKDFSDIPYYHYTIVNNETTFEFDLNKYGDYLYNFDKYYTDLGARE